VDISIMIAVGVMVVGAVVMAWALMRRRQFAVPVVALMVMPRLEDAPRPPPRRRLAKGSVELASVDADAAGAFDRPRTLRPSHARR